MPAKPRSASPAALKKASLGPCPKCGVHLNQGRVAAGREQAEYWWAECPACFVTRLAETPQALREWWYDMTHAQ